MRLCAPYQTCSASHGTRCHTLRDSNATLHRAQVITYFLLPSPKTWLLSIFWQWVAKNYPTPVDVYQLTRVLQQVWQSKLFRPSSSTSQCCIKCLSYNGSHTCCGLLWTRDTSVTLKKKGGVILLHTSLLLLLEIKWVLYKLLLSDWNKCCLFQNYQWILSVYFSSVFIWPLIFWWQITMFVITSNLSRFLNWVPAEYK